MENEEKIEMSRLGVPGGIIAALIGAGGVVCSAILFELANVLVFSLALFFYRGPHSSG